MGCGCCITTFKDEVEDQIFSYIKRIKKHERTKNVIINEIQKDLTQRAETIEKYNYPYRREDVDKTVNIYKNYIYKRFNGNVELIEDKKEPKKNKEDENKIKNNDKKLILNSQNNIVLEKDPDKNKKSNEIKNTDKFINSIENKESIVNYKNDNEPKVINSIINIKKKNYNNNFNFL